MKIAPPTLPGMPAANSKPLRPARAAVKAVSIIRAPASAVTVFALTVIFFISVKIMTRPAIPLSRIIKLDALPITVKGIFFSRVT